MSRPYKKFLADFYTSESAKNWPPLLQKKANGRAFRSAEVQKFAREFPHGLDFRPHFQLVPAVL